MKCPKCDFGMLESAGSRDVTTKSGSISKCAILIFKCLRCQSKSEWRRTWVNGTMMMRPHEISR